MEKSSLFFCQSFRPVHSLFKSRYLYGLKRLYYVFLAWPLAFSTPIANAQDPIPFQPSRVIPPSPNAASLGIYGNYDVGYYTGRPDINIPLYQIKTANHSVPIRLQYDASGVKASQQASWVGLSWSLSAGGIITRTVRGLDDFGNNGYYLAPPLPPAFTLADKSYFDQISVGTMDSEADLFSYNVGSYTGSFVMGKQADGGNVFIDKANNLRIEYLSDSRWIITDGEGYKYYLATQEFIRDDYVYSDAIELDNNAPLSAYTYSTKPPVSSSWYLDSIVAPTREVVSFFYENGSNSLTFVQKSEKVSNLLSLTGYCSSASPRFPATNETYTASRQVIMDLYLEKILFTNGSIEFKRTDRNDISFIDAEKPDKLSTVLIKNAEGGLVKAFAFYHSYFDDGSIGRLKLDSLIEYDKYGNSKPPYKFTYFTDNLPNPYTKSIDHWGYYNRQNNTTLTPEHGIRDVDGSLKYFEGANRSADTLDATLKQGVLSSIVYPTGGVTKFDFELHEYSNLYGDDAYAFQTERRNAIANPDHQTSHATDTFTLTEATHVDFTFDYEMAVEGATNFFSIENVYAYVLTETDSTITAFSNYDCPGTDDPPCANSVGEASLVLPPGTYKIHVSYQSGWQTTLSATWKKRVPLEDKKKGGGLRIKSITSYDKGRKANFRRFIYTTNLQTDSASTGRLLAQPGYAYIFVAEDEPLFDCDPYFGEYLMRMSRSIFPVGLTSGGAVVGYDIVTEVIGENGEGGRIEHTFINFEDVPSDFPFIPHHINPLNGQLIQVSTFDSSGQILSKTENDYAIKADTSLQNIIMHQESFPGLPNTYYEVRYYKDYSRWVVKSSERKIEYFGPNEIVGEKQFHYSNFRHKQITRTEVFRSDSTKVVNKYKYPGDYTEADTSSFAYQMVKRNIITPVVEQQILIARDSVELVAGFFTEYELFNSFFYKPKNFFELKVSAPVADTTESNISSTGQILLHSAYALERTFDKYDVNGNLKLFHEVDGEYQSYIWDYRSSLPVCHITNTLDDDVAYTSFESDGHGGWQYSGAVSEVPLSSVSPTGKRFYNLTTAEGIAKSGLTNDRKYVISYWSDANPYSMSGAVEVGSLIAGPTVNGWTYFEHVVKATGTVIVLSGNGSIDELRIYPEQAQMRTYTYEVLTGMTSSTDTNGSTTYFEYDGFQRLRAVKDKDHNVLKRYHYHYASGSQVNE